MCYGLFSYQAEFIVIGISRILPSKPISLLLEQYEAVEARAFLAGIVAHPVGDEALGDDALPEVLQLLVLLNISINPIFLLLIVNS